MLEKITLQLIIQTFAIVVAAISAMIAVRTYRRSTRTKAAEFLTELHQAFFVEKTYKKVRAILDDDSKTAVAKLTDLVTEERADFTDFLNFFELVAYMGNNSVLSKDDVEALLGYYLQILTDKPELRGYIHDKKKGFEHLDNLLMERKTKRHRAGA